MKEISGYEILLRVLGVNVETEWESGVIFNECRSAKNLDLISKHPKADMLMDKKELVELYNNWMNKETSHVYINEQDEFFNTLYISIEKGDISFAPAEHFVECNGLALTPSQSIISKVATGDSIVLTTETNFNNCLSNINSHINNGKDLEGCLSCITNNLDEYKDNYKKMLYLSYIEENLMKDHVFNLENRYTNAQALMILNVNDNKRIDDYVGFVESKFKDTEYFSRVTKLWASSTQVPIGDYKRIPLLLSARGYTIVPNLDEYELMQTIYYLDSLAKIEETTNPHRHFILRSPTGTGKTIAYIMGALAEIASEVNNTKEQLEYETTKCIIYTNNQNIATEVAKEVASLTRGLVSEFEFYCKKNLDTYELIASIQQYKNGLPIEKYNAANNSYENDEIIIYRAIFNSDMEMIGGSEIEINQHIHYGQKENVCNRIITDGNIFDMENMRKTGAFGTFLVAPFMYSNLLSIFGLIDYTTNISTAIFDEVDVFYNDLNLNNFHKLFMKNFTNCAAKTIIFASATIDKDLVYCRDINLSPLIKEHQSHQENLIARHVAADKIKNINTGELEIYTLHSVFSILLEPNQVIDTVESFIDLVFEKLWNLNAKYLYFDTSKGLGRKYIKLISSRQIKICVDGSCEYFKDNDLIPQYVSDILNTPVDFTENEPNTCVLFATDVKLRYVSFEQKCPTSVNRDIYVVNNLKEYKPNIYIEMQEVDHEADSLRDTINSFADGIKESLILYFNDPYVNKCINEASNANTNLKIKTTISIDDIIKSRKLLNNFTIDYKNSYSKIRNIHKPFSDIFIENLIVNPSDSSEFNGNTAANIRHVGRGIDIKGLDDVVLLLPATINWSDIGFNYSEFMQAVGRVGRGGYTGRAVIILYGIPPLDEPADIDDELKIHYQAAINEPINKWDESRALLMINYENNKKLLQQWIQLSKYPMKDETAASEMQTLIGKQKDEMCKMIVDDMQDVKASNPGALLSAAQLIEKDKQIKDLKSKISEGEKQMKDIAYEMIDKENISDDDKANIKIEYRHDKCIPSRQVRPSSLREICADPQIKEMRIAITLLYKQIREMENVKTSSDFMGVIANTLMYTSTKENEMGIAFGAYKNTKTTSMNIDNDLLKKLYGIECDDFL